ncbi:MAG: SDR family oxidoreductase [Oceanospirillaceae bacterium]|nr:SDR family oxidoreductase [Oceanospirillaceae bacterium]
MDLHIGGRHAIVCGASKGLGRACAEALAAEGVHLVINARNREALEQAAAEISMRHSVTVTAVAADITTVEGREAVLSAGRAPDILINNAGGPPPGDFRDWNEEDWHKALQANMVAPIQMIRSVIDGMIERRFGRIVNITSGAVKAPIPTLGLSNGARTGLTGFVAGLARQVAEHNVTINNLLPGPFETDRLRNTLVAEGKAAGITPEEAAHNRMQKTPSKRFGNPAEFGQACVFLCGNNAGYIVGQNLLIDGGAYPGTL